MWPVSNIISPEILSCQKYMRHMIDARKGAEKKEERYDLFSSLLDANDEESDGNAKLSDDELMGNIFIYLIAGHEVGLVVSTPVHTALKQSATA